MTPWVGQSEVRGMLLALSRRERLAATTKAAASNLPLYAFGLPLGVKGFAHLLR